MIFIRWNNATWFVFHLALCYRIFLSRNYSIWHTFKFYFSIFFNLSLSDLIIKDLSVDLRDIWTLQNSETTNQRYEWMINFWI